MKSIKLGESFPIDYPRSNLGSIFYIPKRAYSLMTHLAREGGKQKGKTEIVF